MLDNIIKMALESGIWAALFCFLFLYQLKNSKEREEKYTQTMTTLAEGIKSIALLEDETETIRKDTDVIKANTEKIKDNCAQIISDLKGVL